MNTELTVLMPAYNAEKHIKEAIDSILNQTYTDFEFVIINDGSTDKTQEIIASYNDPRIRLINRANGGVSKALNTGLLEAKGKYIARMDADDRSHPERLAIQIDFIKSHPEYILVGSNGNCCTEEGDFIFTHEIGCYSDEDIKKRLVVDCLFMHSSVLYVKDIIIEAGMYDGRAHSFEDHVLWNKIKNKGKYRILEKALIDYRFNPASVTIDVKDYSEDFMKVKTKAIETGIITPEEERILLSFLKNLDFKKKELSYHRLLAKKYLWNNHNPQKAREHLKKVFQLESLNFKNGALYLLSFLPRKVIQYIYKVGKK